MAQADILDPQADPARPLNTFGCGQCMRLNYICLEPDQAERLRALGLCEGRDLSVLHKSDKVIIRAGGCRLGLHRSLAEGLMCEPIETLDILYPEKIGFWQRMVRAARNALFSRHDAVHTA